VAIDTFDGVVLAGCLVAVFTDIRWRRIPNLLSGAMAIAALVFAALHGPLAAIECVGIMLAMMAVGLFAFSMGWLGGGDVKFMAAIAGGFGFPDALAFILYTSVSGGVLALLSLAVTGKLGTGVRNVAAMLRPLAYQGTVAVAPRTSVMLPYACAIALGALAVVLSHSVAPFLRLRF
jgi:prepilin peptidase CpaA